VECGYNHSYLNTLPCSGSKVLLEVSVSYGCRRYGLITKHEQVQQRDKSRRLFGKEVCHIELLSDLIAGTLRTSRTVKYLQSVRIVDDVNLFASCYANLPAGTLLLIDVVLDILLIDILICGCVDCV
jgi:hypothetical protein